MAESRPVGPSEWLMLDPAQAFDLGYRVRGLQPRFGCGLTSARNLVTRNALVVLLPQGMPPCRQTWNSVVRKRGA